ncbi:MAG: DUF3108 domain-containing protein [Endomicrobiia bacterium]
MFLIINTYCQENKNYIEEEILRLNSNLRSINENYFEPEILKYKIYWEFIYAGDAEISLNLEDIYDVKLYKITTKTKSNASIDILYKVRNQTESYVDFYGFYSLKFVKEQNEAGYYSKDYVLFDYENQQWIYLLDNTTGYINGFVQDVVSSLYWLRFQNIEVGKKYAVDVWAGKIVYPMIIDVLEIKNIKIFDKEYKCFKVEPKVDVRSFPLFKAKGRLFVYLTVDEKKLPVRLESKVFIGRVFADLVEKK